MSYLLRNATEKARNVIMILDCCFPSRMVRGSSHGAKLVSKYWNTAKKFNISKHVNGLRRDGKRQGNLFVEGNPDAVRIVAATSNEEAFEYENREG